MENHIKVYSKKKNLYTKAEGYERKLFDQKVQLTKSIFEPKDLELKETISCKRECKPGFKIFHSKHNWSKTYSSKYVDNLEVISNAYVDKVETGII